MTSFTRWLRVGGSPENGGGYSRWCSSISCFMGFSCWPSQVRFLSPWLGVRMDRSMNRTLPIFSPSDTSSTHLLMVAESWSLQTTGVSEFACWAVMVINVANETLTLTMLSGRTRSRRIVRVFDAFDHRLDEVITPVFLNAGFTETQPYVFRRPDSGGCDLCYFDVAGKSFVVNLGYTPKYMEEIDQLFEPLMSPVTGSTAYLTPKCMTHRPKVYPRGLATQRDRSFRMVVEGLTTHAMSWLASLRVPACYADAVAPTAIMYVARANEVAGRLGRAREAYEEQMRRELGCWEILSFSEFTKFEGAREFVYLCLKLGRELDKCERVMEAIKFRPKIEPLP